MLSPDVERDACPIDPDRRYRCSAQLETDRRRRNGTGEPETGDPISCHPVGRDNQGRVR